MAENVKEYQRLPGRGIRSSGVIAASRTYCTLWLGIDHLLLIDSQAGYSEDYKRFYFRDIQAFIVRKTSSGKAWNIALGILVGIFLLCGFLPDDAVARGFLFGIGGVFGLLLLINSLRGPSCICHVKTAVQLEELPSLKRLRAAEKVFAKIQPFIEQAQGTLGAEEAKMHAEAALQSLAQNAANPAMHVRSGFDEKQSPYKSRLHQILFYLLLMDASFSLIHLFFRPPFFILLESLCNVSLLAVCVIALVKQHETDLAGRIRTLTWVIAGYIGFSMLVGYITMMILSVTGHNGPQGQWELLGAYGALDPFSVPWLMGFLLFGIAGSSTLGLLGLVFFRDFQRRKQETVMPPVIPQDNMPTV